MGPFILGGGFFLGGNCPRGACFLGGDSLVGIFPWGRLSGYHVYVLLLMYSRNEYQYIFISVKIRLLFILVPPQNTVAVGP
jgi:hypothetical protein